MALLSFRQYAKHRDVSVEAVSKAVRLGKISVTKDPTGRKKIDPAIADKEWERNTDPSQVREKKAKADPAKKKIKGSASSSTAPSYIDSRAMRESYQAQIVRLEYEELAGKLARVERVSKAAFELAREVRDSMLSIPDRLAGELAGESNQFKVHKRLTEEIRKALESIVAAAENIPAANKSENIRDTNEVPVATDPELKNV